MLGLLDQATRVQHFRCDLLVGIEMLIECPETNLEPLLLEDIRESALWQPAMKRHLTAFETDLSRITRAGLLPFLTASCGFAKPRTRSSTNAFLLVRRALCRPQAVKTDSHHLLRSLFHNA
jgi:hypothetical protein